MRGIQKEFSSFDSSTDNVVKRLDGALKDVQKLKTRVNVLKEVRKGAESLEEVDEED